MPFKKDPVKSSGEFLGQWSEMKEYVRKVGGHGGTYKANKTQRLSEEFPWPDIQLSDPGIRYPKFNRLSTISMEILELSQR